MGNSYTEEYKDLYHGTTDEYATAIINANEFTPSKTGWCGYGVYFYDIKAKAWWSANRTCSINKQSNPAVIIADIQPLSRVQILDLRSINGIKDFADFVNDTLAELDFDIDNCLDSFECTRLKRAILLDLYCEKNDIKIVVGYFRQDRISDCKNFADAWQLAIGIEAIYCVKDPTTICNIRRV